MSTIQPLLGSLARGENIDDALYDAVHAMLAGEEETTLIAALLMGLRAKGENATELAAACRAMQEAMIVFPNHREALDIVGTGGDNQHTLNISTATALTLAGTGVKVAKHGNRAASSRSGASDVLSSLGVRLEVDHSTLQQALLEVGIAFLWAPLFHPGMKYIGPVRQALKIPTIFNYLGPLCNPARVRRMLLGVANPDMQQAMVEALQQRGCSDVWGVHGADGLDELSITGSNRIVMLKDDTISLWESHPEDAGLPLHPLDAIRGGSPQENAQALRALLAGEHSAYRDMVLYNSAAALMIAGRVQDLREGVTVSTESLDSGAAQGCLDGLVRITNSHE